MSALPACFAANVSMLFTEMPYFERPAVARRAGFSAVESWWPFPVPVASDRDVDRLLSAVADGGVRLAALNFFAGDMAAGDRGVACRPDRQADLDRNLSQVRSIAVATGCRTFNLLYGQLDERFTTEEQHRCAAAAIARAAECVADIGGTVVIEALAGGLNGRYPLETDEDVIALLDDALAAIPNVAMLFDTFHLGHNGVDLEASIRRHSNRIGHVQIADHPGRGEPGSGGLPIATVLRTLTECGYRGAIGCEYRPTRTTEESLVELEQVAA